MINVYVRKCEKCEVDFATYEFSDTICLDCELEKAKSVVVV